MCEAKLARLLVASNHDEAFLSSPVPVWPTLKLLLLTWLSVLDSSSRNKMVHVWLRSEWFLSSSFFHFE